MAETMRGTAPCQRLIAFVASCALHAAVIAAAVAIGLDLTPSPAPPVIMTKLVPADPPAPVVPQRTLPRLLEKLTRSRPVETPAPRAPSEKPEPIRPAEPVQKADPVEKVESIETVSTVESVQPVESTPARKDASPSIAPATETRGVSTAVSDLGDRPETAAHASRMTDAPSAPPASGPTAMAVSTGITQTAIPRGGYQVRPSYPSSARRLGIQGTTTLRIYVATDGRVSEIVVDRSAGHPDLDHAASDAVKRWRFEPARRGTEAVGMWVLLPVEFRLR